MTQKPTGVWLRDADLVYRLADTPYGLSNCDEIAVKQVDGSRRMADREARAEQIRAALQSEPVSRFPYLGDNGVQVVRNGHGRWELHRDGKFVCGCNDLQCKLIDSALDACRRGVHN